MAVDREDIQKLLDLSTQLESQMTPAVKLLVKSLLSVVEHQHQELIALREENQLLRERIEKLEYAQEVNSQNSSLPPGLDPHRKRGKKEVKYNKVKKKRKSGGQQGHKGSTLRKVDNPDEIKKYKLKGRCRSCGQALSTLTNKSYEERQVFEIIIKRNVVSHQAESGYCGCGKRHTACFPEQVKSSVQYGETVRSLVSYLNQYQLIPYERTQEMMSDLFDMNISEGTVFNHNVKMKPALNDFKYWARNDLLNDKILYADESPTRVNKDKYHLHVLSSNKTTLLETFKSRGKEAVEMMNVIPRFKGYLVHDCYAMYFGYDAKDIVCNAHLIRELEFFCTVDKFEWAKKMKDFLAELYEETEELKKKGLKKRSGDDFKEVKKGYRSILATARKELKDLIKKNSKKQEKVVNLFRRMRKHESAILKFTKDFRIPFTNNMAERDLRMSKVHLKISGCFRSYECARYWSLMRSYISTLKKRNLNVWQGVQLLQAPYVEGQLSSILSP